MNRSIEAIPTWSLCYIINGDASGLTDEEIRMVDEAMRKNNIEIVSPRYNEDMCTEPYLTLSKILCKWKQDSVVSLFLYLNSVFKHKHKLIHNQAPV